MPSETTQLDKARRLHHIGDQEAATELLEPLVREPPVDHRALRLLFKVYAECRQIERAKRSYRELLSTDLPDSQVYALHLDMARVYYACDRAAQSLIAIEKAIAVNPSVREAYDLLVQIHESRDSLAEAADTLRDRVKQEPDNADLHCVLAKAYEKMAWWVEAREAAQAASRLNPRMAEPQHILRRVKERLRSNPRLFREAARRRQAVGDTDGMVRLWFAWAEATQEADDFVAVGTLCEQRGQLGHAEYAFNRAINLSAGHPRARQGLQRIQHKKEPPVPLDKDIYNDSELKQIYQWFVKCKDASGAIDFLQRYYDRHPYVPALRLLAYAYRETDQLAAAAQALQEAIEQTSVEVASGDLHSELGSVYLKQGKRMQAKQAFQRALRHQRNHPEAKQQLAALSAPPAHELYEQWDQFRAAGRYEEAVGYYQTFLDAYPYDRNLYIFMGYAYEELGCIEEAYQAHKQAAFLTYTDDAFVKLGEFCRRNDLYTEAAEAFELALQVNKRNRKARRGLARIARWRTSEVEQLQSRTDRPNSQYLYAIWKLARRESRVGEAVRYFAALTGVLADEPTLFSLLGQANEAYGDPRAAAVAYRHKAALQGRAKQYVKLGDFCFRHAGLGAMAVEAYETALELNPFYQQAKDRLALLYPGTSPPSDLITGDSYREDLARDLCDAPEDRAKAKKLHAHFARSKALGHAKATYKRLQEFHPDQPKFSYDLARIYIACGRPQPAWIEAMKALKLGTISRDLKANLEKVVRQAEQKMTQTGRERPPLLSRPSPLVEDVAPTLAIELHSHQPQMSSSASSTTPVRQAQEYLHKARQASMDDISQLWNFLKAAWLYRCAERSDEELDCLIAYGRAVARYHRARGKTVQARNLVVEAMKLAASTAISTSERQAVLVSYILDYLEELERENGVPQAWAAPVRAECQALLDEAQSLAPPQLKVLLGLVESFLTALQQSTVDENFEGPVYRAAVIQRRTGTVLPAREQERLRRILKRWSADFTYPTRETADRAQLELSIPWFYRLPGSTSKLDLEVEVRNVGDIPADSIWIAFNAVTGAKVREPRKFVPFLPGGATRPMTFHLTDIPERFGYLEARLNLGYFDPVKRQEASIHVAPTLQRPDLAFQPLYNPYRVSWSPPRQFSPDYLSEEQAKRLLVDRAGDIDVKWKSEALSRAFDLTTGESVTLGTLGHQVIVHLNEIERVPSEILALDVDVAAETMTAQRDGCSHFVALIDGDRLSGVDKLILACLAAHSDDPALWMRQDELLQELDRWGNRISQEDLFGRTVRLQTYLPLLEVEETLDGSHRYRLAIKLLHIWLRKHWLPSYALANLRQVQVEERDRLTKVLREKLAKATTAHRTYQNAKEEYEKGIIDFGRFTRLAQNQIQERNALLFEIQGILTNEEYTETRELINKVVANESESTIKEALERLARRRGWDETRMKQQLYDEEDDILQKVAYFILDVWQHN